MILKISESKALTLLNLLEDLKSELDTIKSKYTGKNTHSSGFIGDTFYDAMSMWDKQGQQKACQYLVRMLGGAIDDWSQSDSDGAEFISKAHQEVLSLLHKHKVRTN